MSAEKGRERMFMYSICMGKRVMIMEMNIIL